MSQWAVQEKAERNKWGGTLGCDSPGDVSVKPGELQMGGEDTA